jgi:hypothetical protein
METTPLEFKDGKLWVNMPHSELQRIKNKYLYIIAQQLFEKLSNLDSIPSNCELSPLNVTSFRIIITDDLYVSIAVTSSAVDSGSLCETLVNFQGRFVHCDPEYQHSVRELVTYIHKIYNTYVIFNQH